MNILNEFLHNSECSYLEDKTQTMDYKIINDCSADITQNYIERGYRRFGKMYFRPVCENCNECQSIKIDINNYKFSKSEKRVIKKAAEIEIYRQKPSLSQEHLDLFNSYHLFMHSKKGWDYQVTTAQHYFGSFVDAPGNFGYEVLYFHKDKLIAVDLIDILEDGISSIYFYYDPLYASFSLGKLSLLQEIILAKKENKKWIYLGYYVEECSSLNYKANYKPYVTLHGRPKMDTPYTWS